jgi:hypothetical protein
VTRFDDGSELKTGAGREKVTNASTSASGTLPTAGIVRVAPKPGGTKIQAVGETVFYFYPGGVGPYPSVLTAPSTPSSASSTSSSTRPMS